MKEDYTHIVVVLDSSGSMGSIYDDTVAGFNHFLKAQKEAEGEATLSLFEFAQPEIVRAMPQGQVLPWNPNTLIGGVLNNGVANASIQTVNMVVKTDFTPIKAVQELSRQNYNPYGGTPLLDTIAEAMNRTGNALKNLPESLRPSKVLFVIITDGEENASRVYNHQRVMEMIQHQTIVYKWEFIYLGANQDAIAVGRSFGINANRSMSYGVSADAIGSTYTMVAEKTALFRSAKSVDEINASLNWTPEERKSAEDKK